MNRNRRTTQDQVQLERMLAAQATWLHHRPTNYATDVFATTAEDAR